MENNLPDPTKQICSIRIAFPVDTDEQAIECKKKIAELMTDKPDAQITFSILPMQMPMLGNRM